LIWPFEKDKKAFKQAIAATVLLRVQKYIAPPYRIC